jgi:hypothetical protein
VKGGHRERDDPGRRPRRAARKDVGQVAGTTHLTRPTGAGAFDTSLADLRHLFRWHFGPILKRCGQALVEMMLPFTAPLAERVVFEAVSFEVFWPWIRLDGRRPSGRRGGDAQPRPQRHCRTGALTLAQLQRAASRSAEILHRESTRDGARLHALLPGGGSSRRPACRRWRQPSKAWHWTRSCRPTTERPTTWPFSLS